MVLGKLSVPRRPTNWDNRGGGGGGGGGGQGPTALAVGAGGGCLEIFTLLIISLLFLPLCGRRPDMN